MRPLKLFVLFIFFCVGKNYSQGGTWVWVRGSDTARPAPVFGIQGVPDINNTPGGIWNAANWVDTSGNFWVFGGIYDSTPPRILAVMSLSDLWRYEPANNMWTWLKGPGRANVSPNYGVQRTLSSMNNPGPKEWGYLCWTDKSNNLWLYGGVGVQSSNDLWRYNIASNQWAWMNGSNDALHFASVYGEFQQPSISNSPGSRLGTNAAWIDETGNLWFYGGQSGMYYDLYTDMWMYNITTNEWTWMKGPQGSQGLGGGGSYGVKGIESPLNNPPARVEFSHWQDKEGNFYIYGGSYGLDPNTKCLNDVWRYNPVTNNWTWIAGDSTTNIAGTYNQFCESQLNVPVGRTYNNSPQSLSCSNYSYMFGGTSIVGAPYINDKPSVLLQSALNDLWVYNTDNNNWIWLSGSSHYNNLGTYGIMGIPAASNQMPARYGQCMWVDKEGVLWVFGGVGVDTIAGNYMPCCEIQVKNDLWKFIPDTTCVQINCNTTTTTGSDSINIFIPNAFTPNGDGVNDRFTVFAKNISEYSIKIFNREGELLYMSNDIAELNDTARGWDGIYKGVVQNAGVYVYSIMVKDTNGKVFRREGSVTLLR